MPRTASRRHQGLRLHTNRLEAREMTYYGGLPVTTVARTIVDVASRGLADELVIQAIRQALRRGMTTPEDLRTAGLGRGRRAARLIARALEEKEAA